MKLLFLTTFNVPINHEHYFTINVIRHLGSYCLSHDDLEMECITLIKSEDDSEAILRDEPDLSVKYGVNYKTYRYPTSWTSESLITSIAELFKALSPDVLLNLVKQGDPM